MSLTLVYVGAVAGLAPAASLRALAGGGAILVPSGLDAELRDLVARGAGRDESGLLEVDPGDGAALRELHARAMAGEVTVALAGPHGPWLARELRRLAPPGVALATVPAGALFDDALLGQELVSLKRIVDVLRVECPWDREQTPRDIVAYTVEEVYELADAIAAGDAAAEHGELGDLLLQVVLLALMLSERGAGGDLASVARGIEVKLIRRHPHIFADAVATTAAEVKGRWERIKREQEGREGIFHDVPGAFPRCCRRTSCSSAPPASLRLELGRCGVSQGGRGARRAGRAIRRGGRRGGCGGRPPRPGPPRPGAPRPRAP